MRRPLSSLTLAKRKEIFHIDVFPGRLAGYGISIQQISRTISGANVSSHTGDIELNGYKMEVYSGDFFKKVESKWVFWMLFLH
jgi:multidrug efflux pump subunit AcrB